MAPRLSNIVPLALAAALLQSPLEAASPATFPTWAVICAQTDHAPFGSSGVSYVDEYRFKANAKFKSLGMKGTWSKTSKGVFAVDWAASQKQVTQQSVASFVKVKVPYHGLRNIQVQGTVVQGEFFGKIVLKGQGKKAVIHRTGTFFGWQSLSI